MRLDSNQRPPGYKPKEISMGSMVPLERIGLPIENYEFPVMPLNYKGNIILYGIFNDGLAIPFD